MVQRQELLERLLAAHEGYFDVEDTNFTARVNPKTTARTGDTVKFAMDLSKIHIFDKDTENVIVN